MGIFLDEYFCEKLHFIVTVLGDIMKNEDFDTSTEIRY